MKVFIEIHLDPTCMNTLRAVTRVKCLANYKHAIPSVNSPRMYVTRPYFDRKRGRFSFECFPTAGIIVSIKPTTTETRSFCRSDVHNRSGRKGGRVRTTKA